MSDVADDTGYGDDTYDVDESRSKSSLTWVYKVADLI